ncbi:myelin expression factor 2 [Eurosta solidaginis]|uniref:myelin expression factor 2 n=1 Tax=Eurosta solidaginis TaxID=178769 RepID=UPI0035309C83
MKTEANENSNENREKERDRRGRGARGSRFSEAEGSGSGAGDGSTSGGNANRDRSRERRNCRIYISNIPYDYRWQDLKDLFRRMVGSVEYVELFHDENGKARGCGIVEFKDPDNVEKALEKMNRYEINGREIVVKEDHGEQRDQYGRIVRDGGGQQRGGGGGGGGGMDMGYSRRDDDRSGRNNFNMMSNDFNNPSSYNLYGLSASFLESLGINGPLHNKVFVANLDYKVDTKKLKQVFKLAGKVQGVELALDKDGNSRGFAVIEYDHPVEAVQAISMLDRQMLYERRMTVRLDRIPDKGESLKLPEGLGGVGIGLGPNGEPLKDVARNLPNIQQQNQGSSQQSMSSQAMQGASNLIGNMVAASLGGAGVGGANANLFNNPVVQPSPVAPVVQAAAKTLATNTAALNLGNLSSTNLAALTNVVGGLGAALSNPLLTSSLNNLGLNLGAAAGGNDDTIATANAALTNNYSTGGNNYSSGYGGGSAAVGPAFNAYNTGGGNAGGVGGAMDGNDYSSGGGGGGVGVGNMDMYSGGAGVGGGNAGNAGNNARKSDTIIIKNIPLSCTWQTLRDKFRDVGEVKFAEIRGNDLGVVRFFKERDAELAIALMDGSRMEGRTIKVTYF